MEKYRKGVFLVVYAKNKKNNFEYLILRRHLHWAGWEFPKGGLKGKENILKAVLREFKEETGLTALNSKNFNLSGKYKFGREIEKREGMVGQTYECLYAIEAEKGKVKFDKKSILIINGWVLLKH